ncbi:MAG: recombination regulator RecX [Candidatus Promineofilum sp.]|nr:recombination regulator RecX [Promineifilum sp.]MCW5864495.1 regulatory protein RecX [Anaerolineae bacterium]
MSVFVDGAFACGLALDVAAGLRVGQTISAADLAALEQREEVHQARERAVALLARRPRSANEIARQLRRHQHTDDIIQQVLDDLTAAGLLDDSAFAAYWVEQRDTFRPRSRLALRQELSQKGLDREVVSEALEGLDEIDAARRVARKQAGRWRALPEEEWRAKMTRYLLRHGYPYDVVGEVVAEIWPEIKPDDET